MNKPYTHTHAQEVQCVVSSPFLRCLQTAQQICSSLQLPGLTTCNGIVDVLSSHCGIHEQPLVPADNIADYGIKVLTWHHEPIPKYPERTRDGLKRYRTSQDIYQTLKRILLLMLTTCICIYVGFTSDVLPI